MILDVVVDNGVGNGSFGAIILLVAPVARRATTRENIFGSGLWLLVLVVFCEMEMEVMDDPDDDELIDAVVGLDDFSPTSQYEIGYRT